MQTKDRKREGEGLPCTLSRSSSRMLRCTYSLLEEIGILNHVAQWRPVNEDHNPILIDGYTSFWDCLPSD